jgi:hypothetical protein
MKITYNPQTDTRLSQLKPKIMLRFASEAYVGRRNTTPTERTGVVERNRKEAMMKAVMKGLMVLCIILVAFAAAQAQDNYGAIAYSSSTGNWGYSYDYGSRAQAENSALRRCGRDDCEIKVWFKNSCGAMAKASNGALGWSYAASSRAEAESLALSECEARGSNCRIVCWACTSR